MSEKVNSLPGSVTTQMSIRKRNGQLEPVNLEKILKAVSRSGKGLSGVDCYRVAVKTIGGIYDGATTRELDKLSIETAASFIPEHEDYSKLAAALLVEFIRKEVASEGIESFSQSYFAAHRLGLVTDHDISVQDSARKLDNAIDDKNNASFEYYALRTVYETHLLRNPATGRVIETPQQAFMRLAVQRSLTASAAVKEYRQIAKGEVSVPWDSKRYSAPAPDQVKDENIFVRDLTPGMGQAVAERTILRRDAEGTWETWGDVANRVALGNSMLASTDRHPSDSEYRTLRRHIAKGNTLMSGRHLQHGDAEQPTRNQECFTNCSTAAASFIEFYLLLNGSGVGRCYDDDMMLVDWDNAPNIRCVLDTAHPDFIWDATESRRDAIHKYGATEDIAWFQPPLLKEQHAPLSSLWLAEHPENALPAVGDKVIWLQVQDSREGWAKALELWETLAFEKVHKDKLLVLDFTPVRPKGAPIGGMQNRPASGPAPLMNAFAKAAQLKGSGIDRWKQTLYIDHYFAECVLVGGARRAARMSTKQWSDPTVLDFITVKRPLEYIGLSVEEIIKIRADRAAAGLPQLYGFLWSSNNSITVDDEFWDLVRKPIDPLTPQTSLEVHAKLVFALATEAAYADGTGEPGFINSHRLVSKDKGLVELSKSEYVESKKYKLNDDTHLLMSRLAKKARAKKWKMIVNPCAEICLFVLGAFCVIADVVPFHADTLDEAEDAFRTSTRALMRVNLMDSIYSKEVRRTNRIGVGITGIHEFAWKFFGLGFRDLLDEQKSREFWLALARFNRAVADEARSYAAELGVEVPHTSTTVKPAGTTAKLFSLTEGWHLPSMAFWLRWVQFRNDDPLVQTYKANGYPTRELKTYSGTTIVGFPTAPTIATLGLGDKLVTAGEATPEEQYRWLMLGEKYWIHGTDEEGVPVAESYGNQISYTLKFKPDQVSFEGFREMILKYQSRVRCCSVMPQENQGAYEYLPEEPIDEERYLAIKADLAQSVYKKAEIAEEIGREHVDCSSGACPIDFKMGDK